MTRYILPSGMRYATLEERKQFYMSEFNLQAIAEWLKTKPGRTWFAVIIGRHTKIYPEKYRQDTSTTIIIDQYSSLEDVQRQILDFLSEAVYYDRNIYDPNDEKIGQELAFDLDPENITCPVHGTLADKMAKNQGLSFCELELDMVRQETICLYEFLEQTFSELTVVYSGRGFHIHVLDQAAYELSMVERQKIAENAKAAGFHIDAWVTSGEMRLIRLPFSLNGLVSRIVLPLQKDELEKFDPITDKRCVPKFLI
ncbi:MAG: DNA primase [Candidatus Bathyarchaeota archaeon]|nr:DNA primase [Candidatus Bathyarchaeota archaeon]